MPNYKPAMIIPGEGPKTNALVFATREEAEQNAKDLMGRWMLPTGYEVIETEDPVNYRYVDHTLVAVEAENTASST